jgi:hypothetical protein
MVVYRFERGVLRVPKSNFFAISWADSAIGRKPNELRGEKYFQRVEAMEDLQEWRLVNEKCSVADLLFTKVNGALQKHVYFCLFQMVFRKTPFTFGNSKLFFSKVNLENTFPHLLSPNTIWKSVFHICFSETPWSFQKVNGVFENSVVFSKTPSGKGFSKWCFAKLRLLLAIPDCFSEK